MQNLIGKDPINIEDHWNTMYRGGFYRGGLINITWKNLSVAIGALLFFV